MRRPPGSLNRLLTITAAVAVTVIALAAVALAAGGAHSSRAKIRIKCPSAVASGSKVTCRVFGRLPRGPEGPRGAKGATGAKGKTGTRGPAGNAGVSGYEVVSQTFNEVCVVNSGGQRGLSTVQTVNCPGGKRVIGGGADLGTNGSPERRSSVR